MSAVFLEPLDVLFLRGNKLFGDPGSFGESLVPPWPSVAAGALRSRMLADAGVDLEKFARGEMKHPELGTPQQPGPFTVTTFHLARRHADGREEMLMQPPADLVISEHTVEKTTVRALAPTSFAQKGAVPAKPTIIASMPLPLLPVLAEPEKTKPASGFWLKESGWRKYLDGKTPDAGDLVKSSALWVLDLRVGVGLDADARRAADGRLFTVQAVALREGVGFLVAVSDANPPKEGLVRFGGDGRAAAVRSVEWMPPEPDYTAIAQARRCRLVLTTPGLFAHGWLPTGAHPERKREDGAIRFELQGVRGWIVSAAVARHETLSGWDLAHKQPKPAQRAAPTGSVYWLELDEGTRAEALRKLAEHGLWGDPCEDVARRAEGFNRTAIAAWTKTLA